MSSSIQRLSIAAALALHACFPASAQPAPGLDAWGIPKIETMYPLLTEIRGNVHSISTMPRGELAALAPSGLHLFDGTRWTRQAGIDLPHQAIALEGGRVLISCLQGIVELSSRPEGGYAQRIINAPEAMRGIHALMSVATARGHVFGLRGSDLLEIDPAGVTSNHKLPNWANTVFSIGDEIYFTGGATAGINRWDWEKKSLVDCSRFLEIVNYSWPRYSTPRAEGGVWIMTESNVIVGFDGERSWVWPGDARIANRSIHVKSLIEIAPNELALSTSTEGLLIFDAAGKLVRQISKEHGLDVSVAQAGLDAQGGLWIATLESLSRVSLDFQTLVFDERHGLTERVSALAFFRDRLYLATDAGLFVNAANPQSMGQAFELVAESRNMADLFAYDDHLFGAGTQLMALNAQGEVYVISTDGGTSFWQPSRFPNLMLAGNYKGVQIFEKIDGRWTKAELLEGSEVFSLSESRDGAIWGGLGNDKIARISLGEPGERRIDYMPIPMPMNGAWSMPVRIEGEVYINSAPCSRWDTERQVWVEDPSMIYSVGEAPFGFEQVFGRSREDAYVGMNSSHGDTLRRPNASVIGAISSLGNAVDARATSLAYDAQGTAWIGGPFGLARALAPLAPVPALADLPRVHRLVSTRDGVSLPIPEPGGPPLALKPRQDSLLLEVALQNFAGSQHNQYQTFIEGIDSEWSAYSRIAFREITNLAPGSYLIRARARNAAGQTSAALELPIVLLAPWYERAWAYPLYFVVFAGLILGIVRRATQQHIRKAKQLQRLVRERTREIDAKNLALERQAETLEKQNMKLAEKTDELEATTGSLTETLRQLQEAQEQLVATARTAGKAEIATNVLHNVGNVLNSLNVSLTTVSQKVANSNVSRLSRLASMLEERRGDIDEFLARDPRGKHVPEYVIKLAAALSQETQSIAEEIASMGSEVEHIKRIVSAQQAHAKGSHSAEAVNLARLCHKAISITQGGDPLAPCRLVNEIPAHLEIVADKHRVLEVLLNLLRNARDAVIAQGGGEVAVAARKTADGGSIALTVKDDGVGFSPELGVKLFSHGFTTKSNGHGFGLHSAANTAKTLGGELALSSPGEGQGATATLTLPLAPPAKRAPEEPLLQAVEGRPTVR